VDKISNLFAILQQLSARLPIVVKRCGSC